MKWLEVSGAPGVGKSTIVDAWWRPDAIKWDGKGFPEEWREFLALSDRLLQKCSHHPTFHLCEGMTQRSFRKMATVYRMQDDRVYIQTGFTQRGLGFGYRLKDVEEVREYFRLMPVSIGVAMLFADRETVEKRNRERGKDRAFMLQGLERPQEIALEVFEERGIPVIELDTRLPVQENRAALLQFAYD